MQRWMLILSLVCFALPMRAGEADELPVVAVADPQAVAKLTALGVNVMPLAVNTNLLSVSFNLAHSTASEAELALLKPLAEQVVWLNLAGTPVTDAALKGLSALKRLQRLHLERTAIGDDGIAALKDLSELRFINLYATKVSDKGMVHLQGLKKLKNVYLWQSQVTAAGTAELAKALPTALIDRGEDVEKMLAKKDPPPAVAAAGAKAINIKCPLTGKDIDAAATFTYKGQVIAFCCMDCKGKFEKEPEKFIAKVKEFKVEAAAPAAVKPAAARGAIDDEGFIVHWLVLAPFASPEGAAAAELDKDQLTKEAAVTPKAGDKSKVGATELAWKELKATDYFVDFKEFAGDGQTEDVLGYAVAYVSSEAEQKVKLKAGTNDLGKVFLNGAEVIKNTTPHSLDKDQDSADVTLKKGQNVVVLKVINEKGNWAGCVRFIDAAGKPVKNLKISIAP